MNLSLKENWRRGRISFFILAGVFCYLLRLSWLKWGDLIVDTGREAYLPWQICSGKLLYRDISYIYGPVAPYVNALLYKLFGAHLHSLIIGGCIAGIAAVFFIYKISRFFLSVFLSTVTALIFLVVFAFGQYVYFANYNFILPYSFAAVYGVVFALAAVYFFCRHIVKKNTACAYFTGIFACMALLTRVEIGIAVILAISAALLLRKKIGADTDKINGVCPYFLICVIAPLLISAVVYLLFFIAIKEPLYKKAFLDLLFSNMNAHSAFTAWLSGLDNIKENAFLFFRSLLGYIILIVLFSAGGIIVNRALGVKKIFLKNVYLSAAGLFFILAGLFFTAKFFYFDLQYRPLPLLALAVIAICAFGFLKSKTSRTRQEGLILLCIAVLSFVMMLRMLLFARAAHYGFYILAPGLILYNVFFLKVLPDFLGKYTNKFFLKIGFLFVFIYFAATYFNVSKYCYDNKKLQVKSPRGAIYLFDAPKENRRKQLMEYLIENTDEKETLVVFPEGIMINFLTERKNPLYYYTYLPLDLLKKEVREKIISDMEAEKIDYAVINQKSTEEYGRAGFGIDYAEDIRDYILKNYTLSKEFDSYPFTTRHESGVALFKRKR